MLRFHKVCPCVIRWMQQISYSVRLWYCWLALIFLWEWQHFYFGQKIPDDYMKSNGDLKSVFLLRQSWPGICLPAARSPLFSGIKGPPTACSQKLLCLNSCLESHQNPMYVDEHLGAYKARFPSALQQWHQQYCSWQCQASALWFFFLSIPPFKHQYCDEIIKTLLHPDSYTERHQKKSLLNI